MSNDNNSEFAFSFRIADPRVNNRGICETVSEAVDELYDIAATTLVNCPGPALDNFDKTMDNDKKSWESVLKKFVSNDRIRISFNPDTMTAQVLPTSECHESVYDGEEMTDINIRRRIGKLNYEMKQRAIQKVKDGIYPPLNRTEISWIKSNSLHFKPYNQKEYRKRARNKNLFHRRAMENYKKRVYKMLGIELLDSEAWGIVYEESKKHHFYY